MIRQLSAQLRLADLLDIAIVAVLNYALLSWLRDRVSRSFAVVSAIALALFVMAKWLDLYLTTMVFYRGVTVILIAFVVVFQEDIRHAFEKLTSSHLFTGGSLQTDSPAIDTIAEAVAQMSAANVGALLVFPRLQPMDRHLRGGVEVDAKISLPILLSIFHPDSPGHDGAVVISDDRIQRIAVHLPLSPHVERLGSGGTRHAAALGLSERCDALVCVVSEERGTISLAHNGELEVINPTAVAEKMQRYIGRQ